MFSALLLLLLTWLLLPLPADSAMYYLSPQGSDSNPCTDAQPCKTPERGLPLLHSGDTLYLRGGTYGRLQIDPTHLVASGTPGASTVIAGYPGETAILTNGLNLPLYSGPPVRYVTFRNFVVDGRPISVQGCAPTVQMDCGPHFLRFEDIEVKNSATDSAVGAGYGASHLDFVRLHIHHNGADRLDHGMYICTTHTSIRDSDIHDNAGYGIQIFDSSNQHCADDVRIFNNKIHHNRGDGGVTLNYADNLQFYNNLVYNNVGGGVSVAYGNPDNVQIFNNTIVNNGGQPVILGSDCRGCESRVTRAQVRNNIFTGNTYNEVQLQGGTTGVEMTNNLCADLDLGCTLRGDPRFTNPAAFDFTLKGGSPAINAGMSLPSVPTDMVGMPRAQGPAYDLGAYEVAQAPVPSTPNTTRIYVATSGSDSNDCFAAENEQTPRRTVNAGLACLTVPGKRLSIRGGVYDEVLDTTRTPLAGGSDYGTATVIEGYPGEVVTLRLPVGQSLGVFLHNQDHHQIWRNLVIDAANRPWSNGLVLYPGVHDLWFERVEVKNTLTGYEAVYVAGVQNVGFYGCTIHHAGTAGIGFSDVSDNVILERCTLSNNPLDLWWRTGTFGVLMRENHFQSRPPLAVPRRPAPTRTKR